MDGVNQSKEAKKVLWQRTFIKMLPGFPINIIQIAESITIQNLAIYGG